MAKIVVLGCGLMGEVIARDLAVGEGNSVLVVDRLPEAGKRLEGVSGVTFLQGDAFQLCREPGFFKGVDLVVGALPGALGFSALRRVLEGVCPKIVDISFMPEDASDLDGLAREKGSVCLVDCGVAPGLSHVVSARLAEDVEKPESLEILVGGLPQRRRWPFEYISVFSPRDVVEEYTRPARIKWAGKAEKWPPLSRVELVEFEEVGTLEAFLTDGLRSLLNSLDIPFMVEKTLRYPGHADKMALFRKVGFFSRKYIKLGEGRVRPVDLTTRLLEEAWAPEEGDLDLTLMRVSMTGLGKDGNRERRSYEMVHIPRELPTSMACTTGYMCTAVCRLLLSGMWNEPGVHFPEVLGKNKECFGALLKDLAAHNVHVRYSE